MVFWALVACRRESPPPPPPLGIVATAADRVCDEPKDVAPGWSDPTWVVRPLFAVTADEAALRVARDASIDPRIGEAAAVRSLPPALAQYCLALPLTPEALPPPQGNTWSYEQRVVAAAAEVPAWFLAQTAAEICLPESADGGVPVRVTVIDTAPTRAASDPPPGVSPDGHGEAMEHLIAALCPTCEVEVVQRLALPMHLDDGQTRWSAVDGGQFGSIDWLAQAIFRAVDDAPAGTPHVINLSLAFHETFADRGERHDARALFDAVRFARCTGALIVVAAGNRTGPETDGTPQYPAAWSALGSGIDWDCDDLGTPVVGTNDPLPPIGPIGAGAPLVYAAGGLGDDDEPLALSRPGHTWTPLMAYALGVTVDPHQPALTGTSNAAAIVSAAAARTWSGFGTGATADDVMVGVYAEASPVASAPPAELGHVDGATEVRRVGRCDGERPATPDLPCVGACTDLTDASAVTSPEPYGDDLPALASLRPAVSPAPDTSQCPDCTFILRDGVGTLTVDLAHFSGTEARSLVLSTQVRSGAQWKQIALGGIPVEPTSYLIAASPAPARAMLTFEANGTGYAAEIPVLRR